MTFSQVPRLAKPICRTVYERTWGKPAPAWIALDAVLSALMIPRDSNVYEAIGHAVEQKWLMADGAPATSLAITEQGIATVKRVVRRPAPRRKFPLA